MPTQTLAGDFVVVARTPSPELITDDPAILRLPSGNLLATWTFRGTKGEAAHSNPQRFRLAHSADEGQTWEQLAPLEINMGMPFLHDGRLWLVGNRHGRKDVIVTRSDDEGETWVDPVTLFEGYFWNAPTGYAIANGHLYRAFSVLELLEGHWLVHSKLAVAAGDLSRDLLEPASWRLSPFVDHPGSPPELHIGKYPSAWHGDHWLEPNVVNVRGRLRVLSRARIDGYATSGMCAVCDLEDDGRNLDFRFTQFHPMPGGQCKFHIVYDEASRLFWTPANLPTDTQSTQGWEPRLKEMGFAGCPGNERRILMLLYSLDALNWFQAGCLARWPSPLQSFHYATPFIDGGDLLLLVRTSRDAPNQHDSDLITFHRVNDFRSLALELHAQF